VATSPQADLLVQAHRAAQARNAAVIAALVALLWRREVKINDVDRSAARWVELALPRILTARQKSDALARQYVSTLRALELPDLPPFVPTPPDPLDANALRTSLWVTGPVALQKRLQAISGREVTPAEAKALTSDAFDMSGAGAAGAATRHASEGGRGQVVAAVKEDRTALGWVRVTKDDPCYFCAMLASRGVVYKGDSFDDSNSLFAGDGTAKAHDNCSCAMEPVYSRSAKTPGRTDEFADLWGSSTRGKSGRAAILAFRHAYEGR
jgi:hypothetical protein